MWLNPILVASLLFWSGCDTVPIGRLSMISTRELKLENSRLEKVQANVEGKSWHHMIILWPTGTCRIDDAVEHALKKSGGDVMMNVMVHQAYWWIPYIYGRIALFVTGDVYKVVTEMPASATPPPVESPNQQLPR
jgi:hypothetical protein